MPTLYTFTNAGTHDKLSRELWGPHAVAHRLILKAMRGAKSIGDLKIVFDSQVLSPDDVDEVIGDEAPASDYDAQMLPRIRRRLYEDTF
ncbi:hypothetical protein B1992_00055 [Pseudoxanthomonas broegbernensis]|uniref:Uncharacterized protein n=1 Tax=Pseudoxanthomonas broegbernensis TaxID=83619 RepID=A0A7V8GPS5_9GAMM|nr:hypothetical protein [Pseudoxanthomonas broegbernensis]KAF1687885.1 hypothetical protein B1992_00055 [Pseudoxanthomonas broegbernensis]MBB6064874.1 hypothetical protein [Pseudoxanthomonas broegbernensis]